MGDAEAQEVAGAQPVGCDERVLVVELGDGRLREHERLAGPVGAQDGGEAGVVGRVAAPDAGDRAAGLGAGEDVGPELERGLEGIVGER